MRRWFIRISMGLLILILLLIAVVQAVLWSPLPRRIVMQQIEKSLGLRISADSLSTGWLGRSTLTNVSLGLPLSNGDFLKVRKLIIKHNTLIGLAMGNAVTVDSIEIDDPVVEVIQDASGQWNLQQVVELLAKAGGATSAQQSTGSTGIPKLPIVKLVNGSVHVSDNQKHTLALQPLNVSGQPNGALVWNYDATISDAIKVHGEVAPGGDWRHRLSLSVAHLDPLLAGWGVPTTYSAVVKADWSGQFSGGKVTGTLSMQQVTASNVPTLGDVSVSGSVDAQTAGGVVTLRPNKVIITTTYATLPDVGIQSGAIVSDETGLHAQAVKVSMLGGLANLNGRFEPKSQAVDLQANWSGLSLAKKTSQNGSLTASLRQPFANQPVINVELNSSGTLGDPAAGAVTPSSRWDAKLDLKGQGSSWKNIEWVLTAPQLSYSTGKTDVDLSQTTAHISQHLPTIQADVSLPANTNAVRQASATFNGTGAFNLDTSIWNFDATGGFNAVYQSVPVPVTIDFHARGDKDVEKLTSLVVGVSDVTITTDGNYDRSNPKPVDLHVTLTQQQRLVPDAPIQGEVAGSFNIRGILFSERSTADNRSHFRPYLTTDGDLTSNDLVLFNRPIGDIDVKLQGITSSPKISENEYGPVRTDLTTTEFHLFQAPWTFSANYPNADGVLEATLETRRLPLEELARFARIKGVTGELSDAKWVVKLPSLSLTELDLHSEYHLIKPALGGVTADTVDATATLQNGVLRLNPLLARSGNGSVNTTASLDLKDPRHLVTETTVDHWPYAISTAVTALLSAHTNLDVSLRSTPIGASGTMDAAGDLLLGRTRLAHLGLNAEINKRVVDIQKLAGNILTGSFNGTAAMDLDKPLLATGQITWKDVDAASFATVIPQLDGAGGLFSGTITLAPARDPRPLAPVRIDINVASTAGHFRTLQIGNGGLLTMHAVAYADTDRAILDHSDLFLAGGLVHLWGRVDDRRGAGISTQSAIDFEGLQLDQIAHVEPKLDRPLPGVLDGHLGAIRSGPQVSQLLVSAHVNLTNTDLVNFGPLSALYNLMNAGGGGNTPTGRGSVDVAMEQNIIHVTRFQFFNRGIDAHGLFNIGPLNYDNFGDTPVNGQVVGAARALKGSRIQFLSDFDQVFSAVSGGLTTVNVVGTVDHLSFPAATLADIGTAMQELLVGDARGEGQ